jgi:multifunctional beta-oxidation protein
MRSPKVSVKRPGVSNDVTDGVFVAGGTAAIAPGSVAEGDKIIAAAVKAFGTVHVLINNAGILRKSNSFLKA